VQAPAQSRLGSNPGPTSNNLRLPAPLVGDRLQTVTRNATAGEKNLRKALWRDIIKGNFEKIRSIGQAREAGALLRRTYRLFSNDDNFTNCSTKNDVIVALADEFATFMYVVDDGDISSDHLNE
jgi:hypothetical protein